MLGYNNIMIKSPDVFFELTYGSRLYGTSTLSSDTDMKAVYLPSLDDLLLSRKLRTFNVRLDAEGNKIPDDAPMPENGTETEYVPLQTFVRDFVRGQTYALEVAHAVLQQTHRSTDADVVHDFVQELVDRFKNADVHAMVGFAQKQVNDYVRRGERLNAVCRLVRTIVEIQAEVAERAGMPLMSGIVRLDTRMHPFDLHSDIRVLDELAIRADVRIGSALNNNRQLRTLELNGRSYLETTDLTHLREQLQKLVDQYGVRSTTAAEAEVDHKSLSHAVRVYQQAIELLDAGTITFPRLNAEFLLHVKQGLIEPDLVRHLLLNLDDEVRLRVEASTLPRRTPELEAAAETWLLEQLRGLYLSPFAAVL